MADLSTEQTGPHKYGPKEENMNNLFEFTLLALLVVSMALPVLINLLGDNWKDEAKQKETENL
ncbi:MAG: hypothetical protein AAGN35_14885 [Bacteroidota bacterium]